MDKKKVIFIVPYPIGEAPSQRFRFEQYLTYLQAHHYDIEFSSFMSLATWKLLYKPGFFVKKTLGILMGFCRRIGDLFVIPFKDIVFIHREATPIGPPIFEFIVAKVLQKKIIYDFDDAIWLPNTSEHNKIASSLKWHSKVSSICKWSYKVSCGNEYLSKYASNFNKQVYEIPTTIDTTSRHNILSTHEDGRQVIGWTGTHSTIKYLDFLIPILVRLEKKYDFDFLVISNKRPTYDLKSLKFIAWNKATEIEDLSKITIGVMPLEDDQWSAGKCGFKGLQYMSLRIPTIMSPVGVNKEIVEHLVNGILASSLEEWESSLEQLLLDRSLRLKLGEAGRERVVNAYSVKSMEQRYLALLS